MIKKTKEELALEAYMAGLTEKKLKISDNRIVAAQIKAQDPEFSLKMKTINLGKVRSVDHKKFLSELYKGKKKSPESVEKMRLTMIGKPSRNKGKGKPIMTPDGKFETITLAVEFYLLKWDLVYGTIENKIIRYLKNEKKTEWYYIEDKKE